MKKKLLIAASFLAYSNYSFAAPNDLDKAKEMTNLTIEYFGSTNNSLDVGVRFVAAIQGISPEEIRNQLKNNPELIPPSPKQQTLNLLKDQYSNKEIKTIEPAIERQFIAQTEIYKSCKISGVAKKLNEQLFQVPLRCQIPKSDIDSLAPPKISDKATEAEAFAKVADFTAQYLKNTPKKSFNTFMLIEKNGNHFIPNLDDESSFPNSISKAIAGSSE